MEDRTNDINPETGYNYGHRNNIKEFTPDEKATLEKRIEALEAELSRSFRVIAQLHVYLKAYYKGLYKGYGPIDAAEFALQQHPRWLYEKRMKEIEQKEIELRLKRHGIEPST